MLLLYKVSFQFVNSFRVYKPFAVIKFSYLEGVKLKEIHERMLKVYNVCSPTIRTVEKFVAEFKSGRISLEDDPHEGRPKAH